MRSAAASLVLALAAMHSAADTPTWQELTQSANEAQSEGHWAAAEQLVQNAWTVLRQNGAGEADFPSGVLTVVSFYTNGGLGLKAEAILREAENTSAQLPPEHLNRLAILGVKAQTYGNLGRLIDATAVYEQILTMQAKTYGPDSPECRETLQTLANSYDRSGELEKAEALFARLDSLRDRPANPQSRRFVMMIDGPINISFGGRRFERSSLADFYDRHGRFADAEKAYLAAIARAEPDDAVKHGLEPALGAYQNYLRNHRRFTEAQQIQARIMERHQSSGNPPDVNLDFADRVGQAQLYFEAGQYEQADKVYEDALTHFGPDSGQYGSLLQNYASLLVQQGKLDQAEALVHDLDQHATSDPNDYTHDGALSLMAQIRDKAGDQDGANAYRVKLSEIQRSRGWNVPSGINEDTASAQVLLSQGHVDEAWSKIESALAHIDSDGLQNIGYLGQIVNLSGAFPEKNGELADYLIERVEAIQDRKLAATHPLYNPWLIANYERHGDPLGAGRFWSKYLLAIESANGPDSIRLVDPLRQLANVLQAQQNGREAVTATRRVLDIQEKTSGPNCEVVLATLNRLGSLYFGSGNATAAVEAYEREIGLSRRLYGASRNHAGNLVNTAQTYAQWHQFDRAIELASEAVQIMSNPEYASELETFHSVLATIEKQKSAARLANQMP